MKNLYHIKAHSVISAINGDLPTEASVNLPVSNLMFGIGGSFYVQTENGNTEPGTCFFIEADTTNRAVPIDCKGFVVIFFDALSVEHGFLSKKFKGMHAAKLNWNTGDEILTKAFSKMTEEQSDLLLDEVFAKLFDQDRKSLENNFDERIKLVDSYIKKNLKNRISNKELAAMIHLSESRFYHFFKEQTHVNVSKYILWLRLKEVFAKYFQDHRKFSALLSLANFNDLSHLIRSFRSFFGESPKRLLSK